MCLVTKHPKSDVLAEIVLILVCCGMVFAIVFNSYMQYMMMMIITAIINNKCMT